GYLSGYEPELRFNFFLFRIFVYQPFQLVKVLRDAAHIVSETITRNKTVRESHEYFRLLQNSIVRQVTNVIVYVDSCQTVTLTKRLSIKSSALPNQSQSKALILLSQRTSSA